MKYDLAIAHRVCPVLAKRAILYTSKLDMVRAAAVSLAGAIKNKGLRVKLVLILDNCPEEYRQAFDTLFAGLPEIDYECVTGKFGNLPSYAKQHEILHGLMDEAEYLYFSEDDYLYAPDAFTAMMDFLKTPGVDFVTPLDHPDRYSHIVAESVETEVRVSTRCHWRRVGSSCCTFMTTAETFAAAAAPLACGRDGPLWRNLTKDSIFSFRYTVWAALRYLLGKRENWGEFTVLIAWLHCKWRLPFGRRYRLWGPMPSLAVHLSDETLPPFCDRLLREWGVVEHQDVPPKSGG
jgi:hypothetical protein